MKTRHVALSALALLAVVAAAVQPAVADSVQATNRRALMSVVPIGTSSAPVDPEDAPAPAAAAAAAAFAAAATPAAAAANPAAAAAAAAAIYGPSEPDATVGEPATVSPSLPTDAAAAAAAAATAPNATAPNATADATANGAPVAAAAAGRPTRRPTLNIVSVESTSATAKGMFTPLAAATVTVYEHCWFGGRSGTAAPGNYPNLGGTIWNDFISSVRVPAGLKVTLREHSNYGGRGLIITGPADVDCLSRWNFNDLTSSMQIVTNGSPPPPGPDPPVDGSFAGELLRLTNAYRQQNGRRPLTIDGRLNAAAQAHSNDMARTGRFDHVGSDGSSFSQRAERAGYRMGWGAENIAKGFRGAQAAFQGWVNSDGHRRNILMAEVVNMGAACAEGNGGPLCTQVFGSPR